MPGPRATQVEPGPRRYDGDFVAWHGGCLFVGSGGGAITPHAHYALQIAVGSPDGLRVQVGAEGPWVACPGAVVPPRVRHTIDVSGCDWNVVLFVEPETPAGRALVARSGGAPERLPAETSAVFLRRLHRAWRTEADVEQVRLVCRQFVNELATTEPREPSDPRVLAAMAFIRERLSGPVTLAEVARSCHLSPGRFRHLFVAETGMPLRTYLLWRRFLTVWDLLMEGRSLSAAAQLAGFADSAHLSRTSRAMFGLPPSAVQMSGPLARRLRETAVRTS